MMRQLLVDQESALGVNHPDLLRTRAALAYWTAQTGDLKAAIAQAEGTLADAKSLLSDDDQAIVATKLNLETWKNALAPPP